MTFTLEPAWNHPLQESKVALDKVSPRKRILIIDDNSDAALSLKMLLEIGGHQVEVSTDGPTGLEKAQSFKPDSILVDIGLPGMDGYTVLNKLRTCPDTHSALIIAITGYAKLENTQASGNGFDHHLIKPLDFTQLEQILN